MNAVKVEDLTLDELPQRVREALERGETVAVSGDAGKIAELVPFRARRRLGALAGQTVLTGDIEGPTNEPWEALQG